MKDFESQPGISIYSRPKVMDLKIPLAVFPQRLENLENEHGHGKVMEHGKNWPKVMEFCDQSWNFTIFAPELYQICVFLSPLKPIFH